MGRANRISNADSTTGKVAKAKLIHISRTTTSPTTCPHTESINAPICWDCTERGHARDDGDTSSPEADGIKRLARYLNGSKHDLTWSGSTWGKPSTLPEWHPPESGLEIRYSNGISRPRSQSDTAGWHIQETGLQVVQPDTAEKIPTTHEHTLWRRTLGSKEIWGLRRMTFCWVLCCAITLMAASVIGVVIAVTLRDHKTIANNSPTSTSTPTTDTSTTATMSATAATPTLSDMPPCPDANGTMYTDPSTKVDFQRECGLEHDGSDISHHIADSMDDCVAACALSSVCMGAVWISADAGGMDSRRCSLHSDMSQEDDVKVNQYAQSATRIM